VIAAHQSKARSLWNSLRALPTNQPLQAHYSWNPALARSLEFEIRNSKFDIVHVEHLRAARYGLAIRQSKIENRKSKIPTVWDSVDCISHLFAQAARHGRGFFARVITRLELPRTRRYEGWLVPQFDRVLVTSEVDRQALQDLVSSSKFHGPRSTPNSQFAIRNPQSAITVLPNGVDLAYFTPTNQPRDPATLVYLGRMSYHANVAAVLYLVREIMPLVWAQRPEVRLIIVGSDPPRQIRALAGPQSAIRAAHGPPPRGNPQSAIVVTGTVPDVRPYLARATIMVAPMVYGAGIQNKVLEGMATETPVVCTPLAAAALQARTGQDLLVEETAPGLAAAILRLLNDANLCNQMGQAGRRYVEAHHNWDGIAARLEGVYAAVQREAGRVPQDA
jgi:glycosyltransferase involved in cell wall biosynthesis